MVYKNGPPFTL